MSDEHAIGCMALAIIALVLASVGALIYFLWAVAQAALKYASS